MRRAEPRTNADGTTIWTVRFRHGTSPKTGRPGQTSEKFGTRREAERFATLLDALGPQGALDQLYVEEQGGTIPTLDAYAEQHIASLTRITDGTRNDYSRVYARTWSEPLGVLQLHHITRHQIAAVVNDLTTRLADKSVSNAFAILSGVMKGAMLDGLIATSPCTGVKLPRNTEHQTEEINFLTREEYQHLHDAMAPHFQPLLDTLAGTGIRWGEAEALQVRSVNLDTGMLSVTRAAKYNGAKGTREFGPPKTKHGRRTITMPPQLVDTLRPLIEGRAGGDLVFTMPRGGQLRHASFHQRYWVPARDASGRYAKPHDLRHSHASWLIAAGVPLLVVQRRLGHHSIRVTGDIYGHLMPESRAAEAHAAGLVFTDRPLPIEA